MVETLSTLATYAAFVISGAVVALNAIAPLTKTEWDNKALAALVWFHDRVLKVILPTQAKQIEVAKDEGLITTPQQVK